MATYLETVELEHLATADEQQALTREVRRGLVATTTLAVTVDVLRCRGFATF